MGLKDTFLNVSLPHFFQTIVRLGETIEAQEWSRDRVFPGRIFMDEMGPALETARNWGQRNTIWTDGSRPDKGGVVSSGVRLELPGGMDRPMLPPGQQQGGVRRGDLRYSQSAEDLRPRTGAAAATPSLQTRRQPSTEQGQI